MAFDLKCAVTNAILVVLVYLLMLRILGLQSAKTVAEGDSGFQSLEVLLLVSAVIASYANTYLFVMC